MQGGMTMTEREQARDLIVAREKRGTRKGPLTEAQRALLDAERTRAIEAYNAVGELPTSAWTPEYLTERNAAYAEIHRIGRAIDMH